MIDIAKLAERIRTIMPKTIGVNYLNPRYDKPVTVTFNHGISRIVVDVTLEQLNQQEHG